GGCRVRLVPLGLRIPALSRRITGRAERAVRGDLARRCWPLGTVPLHHVATPGARHLDREPADVARRAPDLRDRAGPHQRWPWLSHDCADARDLQRGIRELALRQRRRDVGDLRWGPRTALGAAAGDLTPECSMSRDAAPRPRGHLRPDQVALYGLLVVAALTALAPLLWMVSGSL